MRTKIDQDIFWNQYLSWFYVQQKEFGKAFIQEKAIYKRNPESLAEIVSLGQMAIEEDQTEAATEILGFVLENTKDLETLIQANTYLVEMKLAKAKPADFIAIDTQLKTLLQQFEINPFTLKLQLIQAHFTAFSLKKPEEAKAIITKALTLPLNDYQIADAKMELADIFLFEEKYNQALLYYSQIELDLKNDVMAHEASLKAAKTSYFKTDFDWALKQFKELKSANTQLIANDALEYFLLINDNTVADSTQTALKQFAKGDYLMYQKRNDEAIAHIQKILKKIKGEEFVSEVPIPVYDIITPAEPIKDLSKAKLALLTTGGIVKFGNPDRLPAATAKYYKNYNIEGMEKLIGEDFESVHAGYDPVYANQDPNRVAPLDVLRDMQIEGKFDSLYEYLVTTTGNSTSVKDATRMGEEIARELIAAGVNGVIMTST